MSMPHARPPHIISSRERGFVLIVAMLFLVVLTVLSVSMFHSFTLQERIAGNTREKARALEAAESALQYGEWWLSQGNGSTGASCAGVAAISALSVCSNALTAPATLPWPNRTDYQPPNMQFGTTGGLVASGDIFYYAKPGLYISYLGLSTNGQSLLYQVSAFGSGGSVAAQAVVQSTYQVTGGDKPLDQP